MTKEIMKMYRGRIYRSRIKIINEKNREIIGSEEREGVGRGSRS